jgi:hypothetical protein
MVIKNNNNAVIFIFIIYTINYKVSKSYIYNDQFLSKRKMKKL